MFGLSTTTTGFGDKWSFIIGTGQDKEGGKNWIWIGSLYFSVPHFYIDINIPQTSHVLTNFWFQNEALGKNGNQKI